MLEQIKEILSLRTLPNSKVINHKNIFQIIIPVVLEPYQIVRLLIPTPRLTRGVCLVLEPYQIVRLLINMDLVDIINTSLRTLPNSKVINLI